MFGKMKARCNFIVLLLGFLAACTRPSQVPELEVAEQSRSIEGPSPKLVAVDSLMWRQPDSALALLLPWFDSVAVPAEYDLHYAHLLLSELLYKNYYEQTNRAELLQSEAYFDSISLIINNHPRIPWSHCGLDPQSPEQKENLSFLSARAHYMDGVGHYEGDSLVPACREYLKALEIMEDRFGEKELTGHRALFMAYAFSRLTDVYSDLYLHDQAIYFSRRSLEYYQKLEVPSWYTARMLCEIGAHYNMMDQLDSADYYYREARSVLCDTSILMYRDIRAHQASIECKKNGRPDVALKELYFLLRQSGSVAESMVRKADIGEIYYNEREYDSAFKYLDEVFRKAPSTGSKKQAAEWLVDICKAEGRDSEILEYASFLAPFATQDEYNGAIKSQCAELYNAFRQKEMTFQHQVLARRNKKLTVIVVGGLFFALFVLLIIYLKRKHHFKAQLEAESYAHSVKQKALAGRLKKSNDSLREQAKTIGNLRKAVLDIRQLNANKGDYESFLQEPVCKGIRESLDGKSIKRITIPEDYPDLGLDSQQLLLLATATEKHFKGFEQHLLQLFPKITPLELDICRLMLLGVNEKQVSILLRRDYSTIMEHVRKMKKAFGTEKNLVSFIRTFH